MAPDLALISDDAPFFARAVSQSPPSRWSLRDAMLTMLPLRCKASHKALGLGLSTAYAAGCRVVALKPAVRSLLSDSPLQLADGRLLAMSALPRLLDVDCPGWQRDLLCFCADDNFSCLAARWLAPFLARLYLYGGSESRRQALSRLIYRESGLIALSGPLPPASTLIILPPDAKSAPEAGDAYLWRHWPITALTRENTLIDGHLAEALLLSAQPLPPFTTPLGLLSILGRRSMYNEIRPV